MNIAFGINYWDLENLCEREFLKGGPYWHICTDGCSQKDIFICEEDFKIAMNCLAFCVLECNIKLIAFVIMNNHVHFIVECSELESIHFFNCFRKRLIRCFGHRNRCSILDSFVCGDPIAITSLQQLRNEIVYIHRNPFVARQDVLPYSYQWGSGSIYYNNMMGHIPSQSFSELKFKEKRALHTSTTHHVPESFRIRYGYVSPESIIDKNRCEKFFRHASHYFFALTKNLEAYSEVSKRLGDKICLNDEEVFSAAGLVARKMFGVERINLLVGDQLRQVAIELHNKYKASNKQIARILKLNLDQLNQMFPQME